MEKNKKGWSRNTYEVPPPPTAEEIETARRGDGWDKNMLKDWGVPWPPPKGWYHKLLHGEYR